MARELLITALLLALHRWCNAAGVLVTCGSSIKLKHVSNPKFRLHSHQVSYSRGSGQQSVTAFPSSDDGQSYWIVHGTPAAPCAPGTPVRKGDKLRLQHANTRKWLHSHQFHSPISGGLEISAHGSDHETDGGDVWTITWEGKANVWKQDMKVRFQHVDTNAWLSANEAHQFSHPISGQLEVAGVTRKTRDSDWAAAEGVFYPRNDKEDKPAAGEGGAAAAAGGAADGDKDEL